jgi:hypothetical protein
VSQPAPYNRSFSFTNFQASQPSAPIPGSQVDLELGNVKKTFDGVLSNLALIQRDDGALANGSVTFDTLSPALQTAGLAPALPWVTGKLYSVSASVTHGSAFYRCLVAHTSGAFATDLAAGNWVLIVDFSTIALVAASLIAVTPSGSLTTDVQSSLQALDAGKAPTSHTHVSTAISDSTTPGRALLTAATVAAQNTLLGTTLPLSGVTIPGAAVILSVDSSTQVTMSANATGSATGPLVFAPYGVGDGTSTFGIPNRAYVAVGRDNAGGSASNVTQVSTTLTITSGASSGTVASAAGLAIGMYASHPKLPSGTKITNIVGTTVTFSNAATGNLTASGIRFSPLLDAQTMGATGGSLTHAITLGETPTGIASSVNVTTATSVSVVQYSSIFTSNIGQSGASTGFAFATNNGLTVGSTAASGTGTATSTNTGGLAHLVAQPMIVVNYMIKR